jgi:acetyl-CoA carboxylase carboxyl transferase subunit alpha
LSSPLDFEHELQPLERELESLRKRRDGNGARAEQEEQLKGKIDARLREVYSRLTPWEKVQVSRHRERPYTLDYLQWAFTDFVELRGDRTYADDRAIVGGPAILDGLAVMVIGHQKGRDTRENVERNFGMPHPEGYRKAERLMAQAERMKLPVVTFVDTPGANAGLMDEERGQAEAIASSISTMLALRVPTVSVVIGEGGSGGALAIAVADRLLMLEHSTFTVASPEAAAAILWRDAAKAPDAAGSMRITAQELQEMHLVDGIVPEPVGGAHRNPAAVASAVGSAVGAALDELHRLSVEDLMDQRYSKYRDIRFYAE